MADLERFYCTALTATATESTSTNCDWFTVSFDGLPSSTDREGEREKERERE